MNDGDADDDALAPDADSWQQAIEVDVKSLQAMGTFVIVEKLPPG